MNEGTYVRMDLMAWHPMKILFFSFVLVRLSEVCPFVVGFLLLYSFSRPDFLL